MKAASLRPPVVLLLLAVFAHVPVLAIDESKLAPVPDEAPAPAPAEGVQSLLDEATRLLADDQPQEALSVAERAREEATRLTDCAGQALSERAMAEAFQRTERLDEAIQTLEAAASAWRRCDYAPGEVDVLARIGALLFESQRPEEAKRRLDRALELGLAESVRPIAASQALQDGGRRLAPREDARRFLEAALSIRQRRAPDSRPLLYTLQTLAWLTWINDDYVGHRDFNERSLAILERLVPESQATAQTLMRLANAEVRLDDYSAAEVHHLRAIAIKERIAPASTTLAHSLDNTGVLYRRWGKLAAAEEYHLRALELHETAGPGPLAPAPTLINLGSVAAEQWEFSRAREYLERALALYQEHAPTNPTRALCLGNLREIAVRQGDLLLALDFGRQSLAILEEFAEEAGEDRHHAVGLLGMGELLTELGNLERAEEHYQKALAIFEDKMPGSHQVALTLAALGGVVAARDGDDAGELFRRALAILGESGEEGIDLPHVLTEVARFAERQGDLPQAERYLRRTVSLWESYAPDLPPAGYSTAKLAELLAARGNVTEAFELALRAERIGLGHLRAAIRLMPEREALRYASARASGLDLALTLASEHGAEIPGAKRRALDAVIRTRGAILDEMAERNRLTSNLEDPEVARLVQELRSARQRFSRLVINKPDSGFEEYRQDLEAARATREELERELATKSVAFRRTLHRGRAGFEEVRAALVPGQVVVAFVRYTPAEIASPLRDQSGARVPHSAPTYIAFVVRQDRSEPQLIPLGPAAEIEPLASQWAQEAGSGLSAPGWSPEAAETAYGAAARQLRVRIWDPIVSAVDVAELVFVVLDGALHRANLAALPTGSGKYLIEEGPLLHYLSAERDLVVQEEATTAGKGLLALGAPAYNETTLFASLSPEVEMGQRVMQESGSAVAFRGERSACGDFAALEFAPLPASRREVEEVVSLWKKGRAREAAWELTGREANEAAFKAMAPGVRVLHVAAHGFFLNTACPTATGESLAAWHAVTEFVPQLAGENPLVLTGLALAGANHRQEASSSEEDGILTAEEVAALDLTGVEWAVLSACGTGLGEVEAGEGVFGLRRAFQIAGARTLIVSLWQVEDEAARRWMKSLYQQRFVKRLGTAAAVREASLAELRRRRAKKLSTHPFYWAGFVAAGDWR